MNQSFNHVPLVVKSSVLNNRQFIFLAYLIIGVILYSVILNTPFKTMDDFYAIILNKQIKTVSLHNVKEILTTSFFGDNTYYRPLVNLSFMVEYKFFELNPFFYNLNNVLIHVINSFLVYLILLRVLKENLVSLFVSFVFLIHPIQVEGVANIPGRSILLCSLFFLMSFYFYLIALTALRFRKLIIFVSLICFGLSLLAKESAIVLPFVIGAYEIIFRQKGKLREILLRVSLFAAAIIGYLFWRKYLGLTTAFAWAGVGAVVLGVVTFLKSLFISFQLLILPTELYYDRSMLLLKSFIDPVFWAIIISWVGIIGWFLYKFKTLSKVTLFWIAWFWINLLLVSQIIPVKISFDHISTADHFLYLPLIGFFVCLYFVLQKFFSYLQTQLKVSLVMCKLLIGGWFVFLILTTVQQNIYSSHQISLFEHSLKYNSSNNRVRTALASAHGMNGNFVESKKNFDYILKDTPWDVRAHLGLGKLYIDQGKYWESIQENEMFPHAGLMEDVRRNNLNFAYDHLIKQYEEKLKQEPESARFNYSLGVVLSKYNKPEEAIPYYEKAIQLDPTFKNSYFNLASIQEALGNWQKAVENYEASIKLKDGDHQTDETSYRHLSVIYAIRLNDSVKAQEYSQKAQELEQLKGSSK